MKNNALPGQILAAARRVLVRDGSDRLTLAAVAAEVGITVGGVRYHYPTKRALLEALVTDFVQTFDDHMQQAADEPGARTRAYIDGTFATTPTEMSGGDALTGGLLAAIAVDTALLEPLRAHFARWQRMLDDDGVPAAVATTVRLAMDGYWTAVTLGLAPPDAATSAQLHAFTTHLLDEELRTTRR